MELSPRKLEIAQMDRERLNKLYYLALEKIDKMTRDNNILLTLVDDLELFIRDVIKKTNRSDSRLETPNLSESMVMVTPSPIITNRSYYSPLETSMPNLSESMVMVTPSPPPPPAPTGLIRKSKNWSLNLTPKTPESPNILYRHLNKPSYRDQFIEQTQTPSRKKKGGQRGKNNRNNRTIRKFFKK
jgi:hypothetical protein